MPVNIDMGAVDSGYYPVFQRRWRWVSAEQGFFNLGRQIRPLLGV